MFELPESAAEDFDRDGYVVVRRALDDAGVERVRGWFPRLRAMDAAPSRQILYTHADVPAGRPGMETLMDQWLYPSATVDPEIAPSLLSRLRAAVAAVLGFQPIPFQDVALSKEPRHRPFAWHQDVSYWPVDREDGAICWVALGPMRSENGGLALAPGSHEGPCGPAIDLHTGAPQDGSVPTRMPDRGVVPEIGAGDAIVFHARCWHRSGGSVSTDPRLAWSVSWLHPDTRWSLSRAPRHPVRTAVVDGEEVIQWARTHYPRTID